MAIRYRKKLIIKDLQEGSSPGLKLFKNGIKDCYNWNINWKRGHQSVRLPEPHTTYRGYAVSFRLAYLSPKRSKH